MTIKVKDTLNPLCLYDFCEGANEFYVQYVLGDNVTECPHPKDSDKWKGWWHSKLSKELQSSLGESV